MLARLVNGLTFGFYKTKWTHYLPRRHPERPLQLMFPRWSIVKGDIVQVRAGDDRGKVGKVVKVLRKLNRVVVSKINIHEYTKSHHYLTQEQNKVKKYDSKKRPLYMYPTSDFTMQLLKNQSKSK